MRTGDLANNPKPSNTPPRPILGRQWLAPLIQQQIHEFLEKAPLDVLHGFQGSLSGIGNQQQYSSHTLLKSWERKCGIG